MLPDAFMPEWWSKLGLMGWPLTACCIIMLAVCFERTVFLFKARRGREQEYTRLANILQEHRHHSKPLRDEMAALMLNELQRPYFSGLKLLRIIGTISPMLGLLGTVLGIIAAFRIIAGQTGAITPNLIADGLWEAMLTTAAGLLIALPALLLAHFFRHTSERQLGDYCLMLNRLSLTMEIENQSAKADNAPVYPSPEQAKNFRRTSAKGIAA